MKNLLHEKSLFSRRPQAIKSPFNLIKRLFSLSPLNQFALIPTEQRASERREKGSCVFKLLSLSPSRKEGERNSLHSQMRTHSWGMKGGIRFHISSLARILRHMDTMTKEEPSLNPPVLNERVTNFDRKKRDWNHLPEKR